jgi:hypothetical protein
MSTKISIMILIVMGSLGGVWLSSSHAGDAQVPAPEAVQNIGQALAEAYTFKPVHPNLPDHLFLDEGNGRVLFMMFSKPVSDPTARLLFVGEAIKGRFCAESQPDGGKTGYNHFHRTNTPPGDTSMSGPKGGEGYWFKHVAVTEFDMAPHEEHGAHGGETHYKPGTVQDVPQPPTPKCG